MVIKFCWLLFLFLFIYIYIYIFFFLCLSLGWSSKKEGAPNCGPKMFCVFYSSCSCLYYAFYHLAPHMPSSLRFCIYLWTLCIVGWRWLFQLTLLFYYYYYSFFGFRLDRCFVFLFFLFFCFFYQYKI